MKTPLLNLRSFAFPLSNFAADRRGNTAMMFALSLVPLLGGIGFAVDYAQGLRQKALMQTALDGAVLAGAQAQAQGNSNVTAVVRNYLNAAVGAHTPTAPTVTVDAAQSGVVTANASLVVNNTFTKLVGTPHSTVTVKSQASYGASGSGPGAGKMEVAIVFDTTYSMTGAKLAAAQSAANSLVDTLFAVPGASTKIKVGLAPFAKYVNVGTAYADANWLTSTGPQSISYASANWTCSVQPTYSSTLTPQTCTADGTSYDCSYYAQLTPGVCSSTTSSATATYTWNGCVGSRGGSLDLTDTVALANPVPALVMEPTYNWSYYCPNPLQRLTNDNVSLKAQINALTASDETYIAPGLLWGWRLLSPNAPFADATAYNSGSSKSIVLMTDGFNTHSTRYVSGSTLSPDHEGADVDATGLNLSGDPLEANTITKQTCSAIRAKGITIYAIAFQVSDPVIRGILQNCATSVSYYYDATTIAALTAAFSNIGRQLTQLRLTQ